MATEIGVAYLSVVPSLKGATDELEKQLGAAEGDISRKGKFGSKLWGGLKKTAVGAGVAIGGVLAGSIAKGFQRLSAIEQAEAKLTGLGHSAESVEAIMDNALAAVKGTAFGMGEAATAASSAVAAGIKPGKELEGYLRLVGDAATIAGTDIGEMGSIFGKVAANGKLSGDVLNQMTERGIGLLPELAKHYGVTNEEAQKMVSEGKVSFEDFSEVMDDMLGGAALKAGNTTQGAFQNMGAAMGRFGAAILKDVYPLIGPLLNKVTDLFDYLTDAAGPILEQVSEKLAEFGQGIKGVWDILANGDYTGAENLFGFEEDSAFVGFLFTVRDAALELWEKALLPLGNFIRDNIIPIFAGLGAGALYAGITAVVGAISGAIAAAGGLAAVIGGAVGAIAWIPIAIGAAIAALVWFFRETELGQRIFQGLVSFVTETLWPGIVGAFEAIRDFVVNELWPMFKSRFEAIRDLAVQVWQGVIQPAFEQFVGFMQDTMLPIIQRLWEEYVKPAFEGIGALAVWLWENAVKPAMAGMDNFIGNILGPAIVWLWENVVSPIFGLIGTFIGWVWETLIFPYLDAMKYFVTEMLPPALEWLWETAKTVWEGISTAIGATVDWFQNVAWPAISGVIEWVKNAFGAMRDYVAAVWAYARDQAIKPVVNWLKTWVWPVIDMVIALIKIGFGAMRDSLNAAWSYVRDNVIRPVVNWFRYTAWPILQTAIEAIKLAFNVMRDSLKAAWQFVRDNVIRPVVSWFRDTAWPTVRSTIDSIKTGFDVMKSAIDTAWSFVKDRVIAPVANWFRDTIKPLFDRSTDGVSDAFTSMKNSIKKAWEAVKTAAKAPIKFVVKTVVNDALIENFNKVAKKLGTARLPNVSLPSGFARGGILPGMSRMRDGDDQLVPMRRGEGVLVSEGLRTARDRAAFMAANAAGRRGVGFASLMEGGFAKGGILGKVWNGAKGVGRAAKDLAGDALDKVLDGIDFVAEALKDPSSIFKKVYDAVVGNIPGAGNMVAMAKGAGSKLLGGVVDKVKDLISPSADVPPGAAKAGGSLGMAQQMARSFGLTMTSFKRPGARTAGSGVQSLHALGRAMDFSNSSGPTPQMMAFFNAMHPFRPTELLYSPAGGRQWRRSGRMADTSGATKRMHYNHVHVGFAGGGILGKPFLHDSGGWHDPGNLSLNLTRKPEAVLTNGQWATMSRLAEQGMAVDRGPSIHIENAGLSPADVVDEMARRERRARSLRRRVVA